MLIIGFLLYILYGWEKSEAKIDILIFIQKDLPKIIRRYFVLLVGASFAAAFITYYITTTDPSVYEAKARLLIGPTMDSLSTDYDDLRIGGGLVQTYAELGETLPLLQNTSDQLDLGLSAIEIDNLVEIRSNADTRIITIIVRYEDPDTAVDIANALSESLFNLSPSSQASAQPSLTKLQADVDLLQQTITNTQAYIKALETEYNAIQVETQDITREEIALINQYRSIESEFSIERSRLSNAIRNQGSNYGTLNDEAWVTSSDANIMKLQVISHIGLTEEIIQDSIIRVDRLAAQLNELGDDFDYTSYFLSLSLIDRQNEIEKLLSQERSRLGDQIRTLSLTIDISYAFDNNPNQVTIIESAVTAINIDNLLEIKVVASAATGLVTALVIVIFIEMLRTSSSPSEKTVSSKDDKKSKG